LSERAAIREIGIALITSLQYNTQNMLSQAEGKAKIDGINELGPLQNQIATPHNGPEIVLDNLGKHAMWGR